MTQKGLRENYLGGPRVILFFTSDQCAWCDIVKGMLDTVSLELGTPTIIYEVNIDHHQSIAEAYGIMMVPTLVSKGNMICGMPTATDLTSFLMQSMTESTGIRLEANPGNLIRSAGRLMGLSKESQSDSKQRPMEQIKSTKP